MRVPSTSSRCKAFGLLEFVVALVAVAVLAFVAYRAFGRVFETSHLQRLESEITVLNVGVEVFLGRGGDFRGVHSPQAALERMQAFQAERRGLELIDPNLRARMLDFEDLESDVPRIVWDRTVDRFAITDSGPGVASFFVDDAASSRRTVRGASESTGSMPASKGRLSTLLAPRLEPAGGSYPAEAYPLEVRIVNPNPAFSTWVEVARNGDAFETYTGPIRVEAGTVLEVVAGGDGSLWKPSRAVEAEYR